MLIHIHGGGIMFLEQTGIVKYSSLHCYQETFLVLVTVTCYSR